MGNYVGEAPVYSRDQGMDFQIAYGTSGNANGLQEYIGYAFPGALSSAARWQIRKLTYDSSQREVSIRFANGSDNFDKIWDSRTSYDYDPDS